MSPYIFHTFPSVNLPYGQWPALPLAAGDSWILCKCVEVCQLTLFSCPVLMWMTSLSIVYNINLILILPSFLQGRPTWYVFYSAVIGFIYKGGDIHSVSKEAHHKFIGFPWNPGSRSGDPGRVVFYHENLKQFAKNPNNFGMGFF